ncbi:hypothetical protein AXY1_48 [Achromobacter phage AXY1]|nr:hypothetical protein AXY1_48 [Achromobacter phage AXY1]
MLTFKDTTTDMFWRFEDDIHFEQTEEGYIFFDVYGERLIKVPTTLVPAEYVEPPPVFEVPSVVSRYQGREAMRMTDYGDGSLFDAFEALLTNPDTPAYYRRAWEELLTFERNSPMLAAAADMLGLTSADLDDLFHLAGSIRA